MIPSAAPSTSNYARDTVLWCDDDYWELSRCEGFVRPSIPRRWQRRIFLLATLGTLPDPMAGEERLRRNIFHRCGHSHKWHTAAEFQGLSIGWAPRILGAGEVWECGGTAGQRRGSC